ncbi:cytochrome P450 family protein [Pleurotus pulmonarius]
MMFIMFWKYHIHIDILTSRTDYLRSYDVTGELGFASVGFYGLEYNMPQRTMMDIFACFFVGSVFLLVARTFARRRRGHLGILRGPPSPSWLLGNVLEMRSQAEIGDLEFAWVRQYGATFKTGACWGKDDIFTCDPRALQHIFQTSGYHYPKRSDIDQLARNILGKSIVSAVGDEHQRHSKIMSPAFSPEQLHSFLPLFQNTASRMAQKWKDLVQIGDRTFNVSQWLSRSILDGTGVAAFDYQFGALESTQTPLFKSLENLFSDALLYPTGVDLLFTGLWEHIPTTILQWVVECIPTKETIRFRTFRGIARSISKGLIEEKASASLMDGTSRDLLSVLVRANLSEDPKCQLDEDEMLSQMAAIILAGHETTASTLTWLLYELSRHPQDQNMMREEIRELRAKLPRGTEFTMSHLDSMTFTNACVKEALRLYPVVPMLARTAGTDDVIPLALPIVTKDGETLTELAIHKGQSILVSVCAYNRLPSVWGSDAEKWNPRRFLDMPQEKQTSVGMYANLMTFSAGIRGCIGWRFALIQLQAHLIEVMEEFEFALPEGVEILKLPAGVIVPMVKGKMHEGSQLPLQVSLVEK